MSSAPASSQYVLQYLLSFAAVHVHEGCAHFFCSAMVNTSAKLKHFSLQAGVCGRPKLAKDRKSALPSGHA
ncbi:MAG: hypothetical protein JWO80_5750 [Bryobacterales bacterium]|nr:hypothetical protein [Bryobacterales bacterium]